MTTGTGSADPKDPKAYCLVIPGHDINWYKPPKRCQHILVDYIELADGRRIGWNCRQCPRRHLYKEWTLPS